MYTYRILRNWTNDHYGTFILAKFPKKNTLNQKKLVYKVEAFTLETPIR